MTKMRTTVWAAVVLMVTSACAAANQATEVAETAASQTPALPRADAPCMASEKAREFDFWIGQWDVYHPETGRRQGVNRVERILDGCALMENWSGAGGSNGKSLNLFDPGAGTWRQLWVSDRGNVLDYTRGEFRDGTMRFSGVQMDPAGDTTHQRLNFEALAPDTVRQVFLESRDGGSTWETTWVGIYVRRVPTSQ